MFIKLIWKIMIYADTLVLNMDLYGSGKLARDDFVCTQMVHQWYGGYDSSFKLSGFSMALMVAVGLQHVSDCFV